MPDCFFIGGPLDGVWRTIDKPTSEIRVPSGDKISSEDELVNIFADDNPLWDLPPIKKKNDLYYSYDRFVGRNKESPDDALIVYAGKDITRIQMSVRVENELRRQRDKKEEPFEFSAPVPLTAFGESKRRIVKN